MHLKFLALGLLGAAALPAVFRPVGPSHLPIVPLNRVMLKSEHGPPADLVAWKVESKDDRVVEAVLVSSVMSMAPYFESARLERVVGGTATICGEFGKPVLRDTGTNRYWVFSLPRATVGACAGKSVGVFVAVGIRSSVETKSDPSP